MSVPIRITAWALFLMVVGAASATAGTPAEVPLVERLVKEALEANPGLKGADARWRMAETRVAQVSSLDDPQLSLALLNYPVDSFSADEAPMTGNEIRLAQKFPFPGKLGARGNLAEQQAVWFRHMSAEERLQTERGVRDAYWRLAFEDRAIGITEKTIKVFDDLIRFVETRYQVGQAVQQDVLKAQVQRSKLTERLVNLKMKRASILADLNSLLSREMSRPLETEAGDPAVADSPGMSALEEVAEKNRPMLRAYRSLLDRYQAQKEVARLEYFPDFSLWAGYRFRDDGLPDDGTDFASVGVTVNLPVYRSRREAAVAEADSGIRMAVSQYHDARNRVNSQIQGSLSRLDSSRQLEVLYRTGIIPQASQAYRAALAAYQVGKVDYLSVQDALLSLLGYQIEHQKAVTGAQRAEAQLQAETGKSLTSLSTKQ